MKSKLKNILISPLDWGLGHTTRCIPIIDSLLRKNHRITAAVNAQQKSILKEYFPNIKYVELEGYNIEYSLRESMTWSMIKQSSKILSAIKNETQWVADYVNENPQDLIISDNRFGFYHPRIESIYVTHQINIQGPSLLKPLLYNIHKGYIDNFHQCWIPDTPENQLAGALSRTKIDRFHYIGPISRFTKPAENNDIKYKYLGIVSGPEPQKSVLCKLLEEAFLETNEPCAIIGGQPLDKESYTKGKLSYFSHLKTDEFYKVVSQSELVISRSGYSTIMDFSVLQKPIYFVPTPGQTEQEYLAEFHQRHSGVGFCKQKDFKLAAIDSYGKLPIHEDNGIDINSLLDII